MITYFLVSIASIFAIFLPVIGLAAIIFLANANKTRPVGFLHLMPYGLLFVIAADNFFSGRSLNHEFDILQHEAVRSAISGWLIRFCTLFTIAAALERIANFLIKERHLLGRSAPLTITFSLFWLGSVGITSVFSANPTFAHEYLYSLFFGFGLLCLSGEEVHRFTISLRNALLLFIALSFVCILLNPQLVMQTNYSQGFIPGLPRMAGLAAHAVVFGVLSLILLVLTIKFPFSRVGVQKLVLTLAIIGLFMAQSKTVWLTTIQVLGILGYFSIKAKIDKEPLLKSQMTLSLIAAMIFAVSMIVIIATIGGLVAKVSHFLDSKDGAQLLTLTGRDIIWDFALTEWHKHPIFGYGPGFLNYEHRTSVGLVTAIHAHNQFVDLLARSGIVGLLSVIVYLIVIIWSIYKLKNNQYRDLAIVAFIIVLNRCVSEVPLSLYGYGHEFLIHLFMLAPLLLLDKSKANHNFNLAHR